MKNRCRILCSLFILSLFVFSQGLVSSAASQPEGSKLIGAKAAKADTSLTLEEMLTYAMQDEYLARAKYELVVEKFGSQRPFSNIIRAENNHISHLRPLFSKYNVQVPADNARDYLSIPASLKESFVAGVQGEIENIEMYEKFLKENIPDDVKAVFTRLRDASKNHLKAFQKGLSR